MIVIFSYSKNCPLKFSISHGAMQFHILIATCRFPFFSFRHCILELYHLCVHYILSKKFRFTYFIIKRKKVGKIIPEQIEMYDWDNFKYAFNSQVGKMPIRLKIFFSPKFTGIIDWHILKCLWLIPTILEP